jgi:hypothetical protein
VRDCWAWGATGHEWISGIAIEKLHDSVPAFVRTPEAAAEIAGMGRELDRSKGAGKVHDAERDPGHYVDLGDNGEVMGVIPLSKLPPTREALAGENSTIKSMVLDGTAGRLLLADSVEKLSFPLRRATLSRQRQSRGHRDSK